MNDVSYQLMQLPEHPVDKLKKIWREQFGEDAPLGSKKEFLIQRIAYQMQVKAYGGLALQQRKRLKHYLPSDESDRKQHKNINRPVSGTVITRVWNDVEYRVKVLSNGFEYNNVTYRSLSKIAEEITGTHRSGPLFFGLKRRG